MIRGISNYYNHRSLAR